VKRGSLWTWRRWVDEAPEWSHFLRHFSLYYIFSCNLYLTRYLKVTHILFRYIIFIAYVFIVYQAIVIEAAASAAQQSDKWNVCHVQADWYEQYNLDRPFYLRHASIVNAKLHTFKCQIKMHCCLIFLLKRVQHILIVYVQVWTYSKLVDLTWNVFSIIIGQPRSRSV